MRGFISVRVPVEIARVPISARSARFSRMIIESNLSDLVEAGAVFTKNTAPKNQICAAFRVDDEIISKIENARLARKKSGKGFSLSALVARLFL